MCTGCTTSTTNTSIRQTVLTISTIRTIYLETDMKKNIAANFGELLNPNANPTKAQGSAQDTQTEKAAANKIVCYSIPPETAEKIRQIAAWDRKKINAVVTEAFEQYAAKWKPTVEEPPMFKNKK